MHKTIKKAIAGISALAMTAAMSATTIPAFASEYEALDAQEYVNSFEDSETRAVAQYCLDNGLSLDETMSMMDTYQKGLELIASRNDSANDGIALTSTKIDVTINDTFYNGTRIAQTPHRGLILVKDRTASMKCAIEITWLAENVFYDVDNLQYTVLDDYGKSVYANVINNKEDKDDDDEEEDDDELNCLSISGRIPKKSDVKGQIGCLVSFPIELGAKARSEAQVKNSLIMDASGCTSTNGKDSELELHTYALGDFDHNGIVDEADSAYLMKFATSYDIDFHYKGVSVDVAGAVNLMAADANEDGVLDISDVAKVNKWINQ